MDIIIAVLCYELNQLGWDVRLQRKDHLLLMEGLCGTFEPLLYHLLPLFGHLTHQEIGGVIRRQHVVYGGRFRVKQNDFATSISQSQSKENEKATDVMEKKVPRERTLNPDDGRSRQGGLRVGQMELMPLLSDGAAKVLKESFSITIDKNKAIVLEQPQQTD